MVRPQSYSPKLDAGTTSARPSPARSDSHAPASRHWRGMSAKVPRGAIAPDRPGDAATRTTSPTAADGRDPEREPALAERHGGPVQGMGQGHREGQPNERVGLVDVAEGHERAVEQCLGRGSERGGHRAHVCDSQQEDPEAQGQEQEPAFR